MGWRDRPYARRDNDAGPPRRVSGIMGGAPRPGSVVKTLIIINAVVFLAQILLRGTPSAVLAVVPKYWWQVWRYLTFQFLHAGVGHILFNMIALYFLGMFLEANWGPKRFLWFYLICGAIAGITHVIMTPILNQPWSVPLVGASGGIYAVLLACAVLFPNIKVLVFFLFPVRLWILAAVLLGIAFINVLAGIGAAMAGRTLAGGISHPAHLGGAAAAAVWMWVVPRLRMNLRPGGRVGRGRWERKLKSRKRQEEKIDLILDKIRREGIGSLSRREKQTLSEATERQRQEQRDIYKP